MTNAAYCPPLNNISLSVIDMRLTETWFVDGLGFLPAGGNLLLMSGPVAERVQGLKGAASCAWWLVGRNSWCQFELFQFRSPLARLMPKDFRPCDIGYTRIGVHVADFDAALANLAGLGSEPLAPVQGGPGHRRACVRNPDGVYVEIMEDDPLPQPAGSERADCPVAVRSMTISTPDLDASVAYLTAICGKGPEDIALHTPEHEALWGLSGATCKRAVFRSGDVLVELVQYLRPVGRPRPADYRVSDQGVLNIGFGARNKRDHRQVYERVRAFGARPNWRPFDFDGAGAVYMNDDLGFSVGILWNGQGSGDRKYGFTPLPRYQRPEPDNRVMEASIRIEAPVAQVWNVLSDQDRMSAWSGFDEVTVLREGQTSRHGVGSERIMKGAPGAFFEQIVGFEDQKRIRYRMIKGAPFHFHRAELTLNDLGAATEVHWRISFRGKLPFVGALIQGQMQPLMTRILNEGLKPYAELRTA